MTLSGCISIEADNLDEAKAIARDRIETSYGAIGYTVEDVDLTCEDDEEESDDMISQAVKYVRENMDEDDMAILQAEMNKCYKMHLIPNENVMDCDRVIELLDEFGEENDLGERWWEDECDLDEILTKL